MSEKAVPLRYDSSYTLDQVKWEPVLYMQACMQSPGHLMAACTPEHAQHHSQVTNSTPSNARSFLAGGRFSLLCSSNAGRSAVQSAMF